jgi:DNA-binding transcriptional regulator LsrR (DeoR family)
MAEQPGRGARDHLRLMTVASRLYHERGIRQRDIATRLGISQPGVSRLLAQAQEQGIVRTVVVAPEGLYPELEEGLEDAYGLRECHVVDVPGGDEAIPHELGGAVARYLEEGTLWGSVVGFTSWSATLREMTRALAPVRRPATTHVVEMLGDLGSPLLQHEAGQATLRLARLLGAEPVLLRTPGVVATRELRDAALRDPHVSRALRLLDRVDVAFVGIGPADVHGALREGDNFFSAAQLADVRAAGAVGQLDQRFIDAHGLPVDTPLDDLVTGMTLPQLRSAGLRVVVAGGTSKWRALAGALSGGWVDVLVTDLASARHLISQHAATQQDAPQIPTTQEH